MTQNISTKESDIKKSDIKESDKADIHLFWPSDHYELVKI